MEVGADDFQPAFTDLERGGLKRVCVRAINEPSFEGFVGWDLGPDGGERGDLVAVETVVRGIMRREI